MSRIPLKTDSQIAQMRESGRLTYQTLKLMESMVKPGISTKELDEAAYAFITSHGAVPSFLNYHGYPGTICASVNEQVVHGIPGGYVLKEGDIVSIDVGACLGGWHGDAARTFFVGEVDESVRRLVEVTRQCFFEGLKYAVEGRYVEDISRAIEEYAVKHGYGVVKELTGHGIGRRMHEEPEVLNYVRRGIVPKSEREQVRLECGMTIAVEPMINMGKAAVRFMPDGWTVITADKKPSAHYENTIAITEGGPIILTAE